MPGITVVATPIRAARSRQRAPRRGEQRLDRLWQGAGEVEQRALAAADLGRVVDVEDLHAARDSSIRSSSSASTRSQIARPGEARAPARRRRARAAAPARGRAAASSPRSPGPGGRSGRPAGRSRRRRPRRGRRRRCRPGPACRRRRPRGRRCRSPRRRSRRRAAGSASPAASARRSHELRSASETAPEKADGVADPLGVGQVFEAGAQRPVADHDPLHVGHRGPDQRQRPDDHVVALVAVLEPGDRQQRRPLLRQRLGLGGEVDAGGIKLIGAGAAQALRTSSEV